MRIAITALGVAGTMVLLTGAGYVYTGGFDVAATTPHSSLTYDIIETARNRSIIVRAAAIVAPASLTQPSAILAGAAHFADHCAVCHAAPGIQAEDMAEGMYPKPPDLTEAARRWKPGELFWILKNGIKMSGMPSWGDHGDEDLWDIVAFLEKLPGMTPEQYSSLSKAAAAAGGHRMHGGTMNMNTPMKMDMPMKMPAPTNAPPG